MKAMVQQYPYYHTNYQSKSTTMTASSITTTTSSSTMMEEEDVLTVDENMMVMVKDENECSSCTTDKEILLTTSSCIEAMMKQETCHKYKVNDYLNINNDKNVDKKVVVVDEICREKMYDWCNQTIDFFYLNRHSVHVTMNCLDRFLSTPKGQTYLTSKTLYQLACITCLYICIKTHEPIELSASMIVELCRGTYTIQQIYNTETIILHTLNWYMNPPTHYSYVKRLLYKLNNNNTTSRQQQQEQEEVAIDDLAKQYCNMVVGDYTLSVHYKPSVVAFGCAMATIQSCSSQQQINTSTNKFVMEHCWHLLSFDDYTKVNEISNALIKATMNGSNNNDVITAATRTTTTAVVSTSRKTKSTVASNNKHKSRHNSSSSNNNNKNNSSRRYSSNNNVATNTRRVSMNDDDDDDNIIKDEDEEAVTKTTSTTTTQHQRRYLSPVTIVGSTT